MGNYRSKFDIIADILFVVKRGEAKKTQIMYGANLSYKVLTKYLTEVIESRLIRVEHQRNCYVLTEKGREFLERYREYLRRNRNAERQLSDVKAKRKALEELFSV